MRSRACLTFDQRRIDPFFNELERQVKRDTYRQSQPPSHDGKRLAERLSTMREDRYTYRGSSFSAVNMTSEIPAPTRLGWTCWPGRVI